MKNLTLIVIFNAQQTQGRGPCHRDGLAASICSFIGIGVHDGSLRPRLLIKADEVLSALYRRDAPAQPALIHMEVLRRVCRQLNGCHAAAVIYGLAHLTLGKTIQAQSLKWTIVLQQAAVVIKQDHVAQVAARRNPFHLDDIIQQVCNFFTLLVVVLSCAGLCGVVRTCADLLRFTKISPHCLFYFIQNFSG